MRVNADENVVQTCITTLTVRHLAAGAGPIAKLDDLRSPMSAVMSKLVEDLAELQMYKAKYGPLTNGQARVEDVSGSDTEQE